MKLKAIEKLKKLLTSRRKLWLYNRVGRTIYVSKRECNCAACQMVYADGVSIFSKRHASHLYYAEMRNSDIIYFDTIEERAKFEQEISQML